MEQSSIFVMLLCFYNQKVIEERLTLKGCVLIDGRQG